ncbi:RtcB family protein [archaeon]|jgi:tRNA-splicing ligase RtcB (3'-phosphate/5'-hydroxy nucleic acid ligase)|nr:RtcB family protein [archaeon]
MDLKKISDVEWEIPVEDGMLVPGRVFASEELIKNIKGDKSLEQIKNVAKLPGILRASYAMPDMHQGYGFPIGGVAAFDVDKGVISPGGVGYDINCSVRLLKTNLTEADLKGKEQEIAHSLFRTIPSGVGRGGDLKLSDDELDEVLVGGAQWAVEKGYGKDDDWKHIEDEGKLGGAEPKFVSGRAKGRGRGQLGSLGAGNHFLDVLIVDEVFDKRVAEIFGLEKGQVVMLIHCGSRGLGHQVASDYIKAMEDEYGVPEYDRELVNAPIKSELGRKYLGAMNCAANFAYANKQLITHFVRENMKNYFADFEAEVVYDICHNIAKFEKFEDKEVLVMRKGATRSFGPGREEIPEDYRTVGQPVLLPGSMGTASYVLVGTKKAEEISWGSTAHGAGRAKSRTQAKRDITFEEARKDMAKRGIVVEFGGQKGMVEESPFSYKDVDEVVRVSDEAGIGKRVAKLRPVMVVIG